MSEDEEELKQEAFRLERELWEKTIDETEENQDLTNEINEIIYTWKKLKQLQEKKINNNNNCFVEKQIEFISRKICLWDSKIITNIPMILNLKKPKFNE
jgi:hypothetical protein